MKMGYVCLPDGWELDPSSQKPQTCSDWKGHWRNSPTIYTSLGLATLIFPRSAKYAPNKCKENYAKGQSNYTFPQFATILKRNL